ncbi:MAG: tetratricopeptide repeat protein [Candidatus Omnitrophica bacterium]|nr:tetratricopeptide repeat protein [Candidatus Omnitrophota bacterium]
MKNWLVLTGIFVFSLLLRLVYLYQLAHTPFLGFFASDSYLYEAFANKIIAGNFAMPEMAYINALYPFFLAVTYRIFGHNLMSVVFVQIVLDSLTCVLLYLICVKAFNKKNIGLLASVIYACYGMAIFYTGFLLGVTLVTFLNVLFVFILLHSRDTDRAALWVSSGLVFGLSALITPFIVLFLLFLILWLFYLRRKYTAGKNAINLLLICAGMMAVLLPFSVRNYVVEKRFSPFPASGGIHFYMGNNPEATGTRIYIKDISTSPIEDVKSSIRKAEQETQRKLTPQQASDYWLGKGLRFIRNEPGRYAAILFRKFILFWNKKEIVSNIDYYFCGNFIPILRFPLFFFGIIAPFALLGFVFALKERSGSVYLIISFILTNMAALLLFTVSDRYRFPCVPFIIILASYAFFKAASYIRPFKAKECALYIAVLICFFAFVNIKLNNEDYEKDCSFINHTSLGRAYLRKGMRKEALSEIREASAVCTGRATSLNALGLIYSEAGMPEKAVESFNKAINIEPDNAEFHYNLAVVYARRNMPESAIAEYQKAIDINPENANAHHALAVLYYLKGMPQKALAEAEKSIAINKERPEPFNIVGLVYSEMGMLDKSVEVFGEAIKIAPANTDSHYNLAGVYAKNGRIKDAIAEYEKTIELDPKYGDAHYRLAVLYYNKKDFEKASYHCSRAIECGFEVPPEFIKSLAEDF